MTKEVSIALPKLGESITSATVVQWFKKEGDRVHLDEALLEVSTDKVNSEIPSPVAGVLHKIVVHAEEEVPVGALLAIVAVQEGDSAPLSEEKRGAPCLRKEEENKDFFSPSVLRIAAEKGISLETLAKIAGTGAGGRITKMDVENYKQAAPCPVKEERVKMTGMRKAIADNMVKSFYEAPHASLVHEVDITAIMQTIEKEKANFLARHGVKVTITSFFVRALAQALQEFPLLNSVVDKDTIVLKKYIHIGIAVSVEQGLIVPVIRHCENRSLSSIAKEISVLSEKARTGGLVPSDVLEGTITVTNFGMSGVGIGIPIIRYPEVAILGMGAIAKKVQVLEGDVLAIRSMVHISLTFDHRVIDGMYGCSFLACLQKHLAHVVIE